MNNSESLNLRSNHFLKAKRFSRNRSSCGAFRRLWEIICLAGTGLLIFAGGCGFGGPRARMGTLPTPPPGPRFSDPNNLGKHSYGFNPFEKNGILYTCKAGHIDLTHVRGNADNTRHVIMQIRKTLIKQKEGFAFNLSGEWSRHYIGFNYPDDWDSMSKQERERIATEVSYDVGAYISFNATLWHEILTWFGVNFAGFEPEFNSAFSWEDMYSNLLGTKLSVEAVRDPNRSYDDAMTLALNKELKRLEVQPRRVAIHASQKMRNIWYRGYILVDTMKKNMDVGYDDGYVTPVLVPGICEGAEPEPLIVPTNDILSKYGLSMTYEVKANYWEEGKIHRAASPDEKIKRVQVDKHYPILLEYIAKEAVEKYNYDIN